MSYQSAPTVNKMSSDQPPSYSTELRPSGHTYISNHGSNHGSNHISLMSPSVGGYAISHQPNLSQLFNEYSFAPYVREDFGTTSNFDLIIICDNSYSMDGERWNKLKEHIKLIVRFGVAIDDDGIDIIFLNPQKIWPDGHLQKEFNNITTSDGVDTLFHEKPAGYTPLSETLNFVMNKPSDKKKMIFILTDGKPYAPNDRGESTDSCDRFSDIIHKRNSDLNRIVIMLCVDGKEDNDVVNFYDSIDESADCVEVLHVYSEEREQVLAIQGPDFTYGLNDHIARMFLSPIFREYDELDEKKLKMTPDGRFNRNMSVSKSRPYRNKKNKDIKGKKKSSKCILM
jgi:hypothetical protein